MISTDTYDMLGGVNKTQSIVMVNGCFDILHRGHVEHLTHANYMGDRLVVALTNDAFVNKGPKRPVNTWADRAHVLLALHVVDDVIATNNAVDAIRLIKPTYFVKGIDYADGGSWTEAVEEACKETGTIIRFTDTPKRSVTDIIKTIYGLAVGNG